jgi:hypothetical protein
MEPEHIDGNPVVKTVELRSKIKIKVTKAHLFDCVDSEIVFNIMAFNEKDEQIDGNIAGDEKGLDRMVAIFCNRWKDGEDAYYLKNWKEPKAIKNKWG